MYVLTLYFLLKNSVEIMIMKTTDNELIEFDITALPYSMLHIPNNIPNEITIERTM